MTPKEKAKQLVDKYYQLAESIEWTDQETSKKAEKLNDELGTDVLRYWNELAKQSALLTVDEIVKSEKLNYLFTKEQLSCMEFTSDDMWIHETFVDYWDEVKEEIEQL
jgi:hypothetical protein